MKKTNEIIILKDVSKHYFLGEEIIKAVDKINITINKGDFIAIIGPSGSGKSTMMNLIGALDIVTNGSIFIDNFNIEKLSGSELALLRGKKIGFVFQTFNLIPTLTALENVMLPMVFQNIPYYDREKIAIKLLEEFGLKERLSHLPNELSGGERQRVAIARALANNPEVILADEPTGNLDSNRSKEIVEMFVKLNKQGKTIILITHNLAITKYANKIYHLKDGKIVK